MPTTPQTQSLSTHVTMAEGALASTRALMIGVIGFLTLVDLFAAQALLPMLVKAYGVSRATMGLAVNASTFGMAVASLGIALISGRVNRWRGIWVSLGLLAIPTSMLAFAPDVVTFAVLRVVQGLLMAAAFTLTAAYLGEHFDGAATSRALAAYVTGIVASNLIGRLVAASAAGMYGLPFNFYVFAALNLMGAVLVYLSFDRMNQMAVPASGQVMMSDWAAHLRDGVMRAAFALGFLILFAFIGIFTYVNFVLAQAPLSVSQMSLGLVYLVFLPAMVTTPLTGSFVARYGTRPTIWVALVVAGVGLPLLLTPSLPAVMGGMVLVGVGTFAAQAAATGFVGRAAKTDRAAASGLYLASYYLGGIAGAALLGLLFDQAGWTVCVTLVAAALVLAAMLASGLTDRT
jgi:predicted MFS family arabinose efflux permease